MTGGDTDVFVTPHRMRRTLKASLHYATGVWQLSYLPDKVPGNRTTRHLIRSHIDAVPAGAPPIGVQIIIPDDCLRPAGDVDSAHEPDYWLPRPPYGGAIVVSVLAVPPAPTLEEWPGHEAGTHGLAWFKMPNGLALWIVYIAVAPPLPPPVAATLVEAPRARGPLLDSPERRLLIGAPSKLGGIVLIEHAID